ncbi:glycosyltransferase family 2 protein [Tunicatimonas pelagia]|uniref:glycosyltransferase family 2 protein n=1 Tax=Tunicatimonas pelagia TaxID=931531 RepID=UPI002664FC34|nr:glycosyltransferase family 2 protein [Tunicatimonas pelagia]WKN44044.1 glycosyltransferase family 2 protein [Tunicatimonas pelagia]
MEPAAVVILNYNGVHFLEQFLPSVVSYSSGHRIIVADNASTDSSLDFLRENYPSVEVFAFSENYGFAEGYNQALNRIENTYSILLNSDAEVTPHWIDPVLKLMDQDSSIAACQPKVRAYHRKNYFEHAGAAGGYIDTLGYPFCRGRILDTTEEDCGQYDSVAPIFWATGACFFVRTEVYKSLGGFDSNFFAHMEEIDLCWRMHRAGYQLYCQPASVVYHVGGGTMSANNPRKTYLNFRNSTAMLYKNESVVRLLWKLPAKLGLDLLAALVFLGQQKPQDAGAALRATRDFIGKLPQWERVSVEQIRTVGGVSSVQSPGLLVFARYLLGKKYFQDLAFAQQLSSTKSDYGSFGDDSGSSPRKQSLGTRE